MKDVIAMAERGGENIELLVIDNADKTTVAEFTKMSSIIDLRSKHSWAISNTNMDATRDLGRIGIKIY